MQNINENEEVPKSMLFLVFTDEYIFYVLP